MTESAPLETANIVIKTPSLSFLNYTRVLIICKLTLFLGAFLTYGAFFIDEEIHTFRYLLIKLGVNVIYLPPFIEMIILAFGSIGFFELINFRRPWKTTLYIFLIALVATGFLHMLFYFEAINIFDAFILFSVMGFLYFYISNLKLLVVILMFLISSCRNDVEVLTEFVNFFSNTTKSNSENLDLIEFREASNAVVTVMPPHEFLTWSWSEADIPYYRINEFLTWSIRGVDSDYFRINENGAIRFSNRPDFENPLDSNADNIYEITVIAIDNSYNSIEKDISIAVTNSRGLLDLFN
ncbi:MAG: hypothetical protein VW306_04175 [Gammaproteobacteria bacterium]